MSLILACFQVEYSRSNRSLLNSPYHHRHHPRVIVTHPGGNVNVGALIRALEREGMLSMFCTTFTTPNWTNSALLPRSIKNKLHRRSYGDLEKCHIKNFPLRDVVRQIARTVGMRFLVRHETGWASDDRVYQALDSSVACLIEKGRLEADAVYAWEDCALQLFLAASKAGIKRFYELPIGYWRIGRRIMEEEAEREPAWAATLDGLLDSEAKFERKDAELQAADHIFVPSTFVRETLREHPSIKATINVIPYGSPSPNPLALAGRQRTPKLRLLYVGLLMQRKGLSYLFQAMRQLGSVATLSLIGPKPLAECAVLDLELQRHNWLGILPHDRVLEIMAQHDILIFPSLFEGFGLVILEAMSQGIPVISTPNGGAPDVIDDGKDGFIVPIRDVDALAERVTELAQDRDRLSAMSAAALKKSEAMYWLNQEKLFIRTIRSHMNSEAG
jgi:glycosyltransferase involved in cell wall biosynthesis